MIEESLNFGMNAVQLSKVSDLQSHISELDQSLQSVLDNLDAVQQEQAEAIEKQEKEYQRQEVEYQKQQIILKLRESVFNFKTNMGDIYQSNELIMESKYLQFRDACMSSAIQTLNPDYFETFKDKEYVVSVKKYLINTRDELFDNLDYNKKSTIKALENKEIQLNKMVDFDMQKPDMPIEPLFSRSKLKNTRKPIQPKGYYADFERDMTEEIRKRGKLLFLGISFATLPSLGVVFTLKYLYKTGKIGLSWDTVGLISMGFMAFCYFIIWIYFVFINPNPYEKKRNFSNYKNTLFEYLKDKESNKNLLKAYEDKLQYYKNNQKIILQNYQNELERYQEHQDDIETLKREILGLRQSFCS